jgi:hypothetical protein
MNSFNLTERFLGHRAIPISQLFRQLLVQSIGLDDVVDQCSTAYAVGKYTGVSLGTSLIWSAGLTAGANTITWSGHGQNALAEAAQLKGTTIGATPIGSMIEALQYQYNVPLGPIWTGIWAAASATFAGNASGVVQAVIRDPGFIWTRIELPILLWRNIPIIYK